MYVSGNAMSVSSLMNQGFTAVHSVVVSLAIRELRQYLGLR
jgi:hypothetical protein